MVNDGRDRTVRRDHCGRLEHLRRGALVAGLVLGAVSLGLVAEAAALAADDTAYEDVAPRTTETQVSAPLSVTIAYGAIWIVLLAYVVGLWRRQAQLAEELAALRRSLERTRQPGQRPAPD